MNPPAPPPVDQRLRERSDRSGGPNACWPWTAAKSAAGYGQLRIDKRAAYAHRAAYELAYGPIPSGASVRHKCDLPACVNPAHLEIGSHADNMRDMASRRRAGQRKLTDDEVRAIRGLRAAGATIRQCAGAVGCSFKSARSVIEGSAYAYIEAA